MFSVPKCGGERVNIDIFHHCYGPFCNNDVALSLAFGHRTILQLSAHKPCLLYHWLWAEPGLVLKAGTHNVETQKVIYMQGCPSGCG